MREDEIEALLAIDNAGLECSDSGLGGKDPSKWEAIIRIPRDFHKPNRPDYTAALAFTGYGETRGEAVANVWQKYQAFVSSETGLRAIADANGQMMFRI